jgi:hypothetical protein
MAIIRELRGQVPSTHLYNHSHLKCWDLSLGGLGIKTSPGISFGRHFLKNNLRKVQWWCDSRGTAPDLQEWSPEINPTSLLTPATIHKWRYRTTCIWEDLDIARREDGTLLVWILLVQPFLKITGSLLKKTKHWTSRWSPNHNSRYDPKQWISDYSRKLWSDVQCNTTDCS